MQLAAAAVATAPLLVLNSGTGTTTIPLGAVGLALVFDDGVRKYETRKPFEGVVLRWNMVDLRNFNFDLTLALQQNDENPAYYVQYAHARIQSILRKAAAEGSEPAADPAAIDYELHPSEELLILDLLEFPSVVAAAAQRRAPHRVATYALELAQSFTAFYRDCKVVGAESPEAEAFRLALCAASGATIKSALGLLGVSAPEEM